MRRGSRSPAVIASAWSPVVRLDDERRYRLLTALGAAVRSRRAPLHCDQDDAWRATTGGIADVNPGPDADHQAITPTTREKR
jgi:hypothetical protein